MPTLADERHDIQGNILRAYTYPFAHFDLVRIADAAGARRLLQRLLQQQRVTTATLWDPGGKPGATLNLYFTWSGLAAMGLAAPALDSFPEEFRQGMAARWQTLGDPDPAGWEFGADPAASHLLFAVYGSSEAERDRMRQAVLDEIQATAPSLEMIHAQPAAMLDGRREHFGFADGFGQPSIEGSGEPEFRGDGTPVGAHAWAPLKPGEFILGWENETPHPGALPAPEALGRNGSYLVLRKLRQDVPAFRKFLREQAARLYGSEAPENLERLAAKLVGRWRSGCPIMLSPESDDPALAADWDRNNDFRYAGDPKGAVCPFGAHVRRMNPRDGLTGAGDPLVRTHRILRRGLPYGQPLAPGEADDGEDRGVLFMAINAHLGYQFETVQREWTNSGEFAGLDRADVDPFAGEPRAASRFRIPSADGAPSNLWNLPRFVSLRGGGYFFIPSITALQFIAG